MKTSGRHFHWMLLCLEWAACLILAGVFLVAAVPKILDPPSFAEAVHRYDLLPFAVGNVVAIYLPWLELVTALALIGLPGARRGALLLTILLLTVFCAGMAIALARGAQIPCGCFSAQDSTSMGWGSIARNVGLGLFAGFALIMRLLNNPRRSRMAVH